jgi:hypothetical protein
MSAHLKPLTPASVAVKVSHLDELRHFFLACEQARSFSRFFWWALKPQPKGGK